MSLLDLGAKPDYSDYVLKYFSYYGINFDDVVHHFGYFYSGEFRLAGHVFLNERNRGTVLFLHGLLDHSGLHPLTYRYFLENGYNVAAFDLPGHGFSEGARGDIEDFESYGKAIHDFLRLLRPKLGTDTYLMGHSAGCAGILEYLYNYHHDVTRTVFAAPLVRSRNWGISVLAARMASMFMDRIERRLEGTSNNPELIDFVEHRDPLSLRYLNLSWVHALEEWDRRNRKYGKQDHNLVVIQGTDDTVLNVSYNLKYLKRRFVDADVHRIEHGSHTILNETPETMFRVYQILDTYFGR
jgi:lysophospholipase